MRAITTVDSVAGFGLSCYSSAATETAWADAGKTADAAMTADAETVWGAAITTAANGLSGFF